MRCVRRARLSPAVVGFAGEASSRWARGGGACAAGCSAGRQWAPQTAAALGGAEAERVTPPLASRHLPEPQTCVTVPAVWSRGGGSHRSRKVAGLPVAEPRDGAPAAAPLAPAPARSAGPPVGRRPPRPPQRLPTRLGLRREAGGPPVLVPRGDAFGPRRRISSTETPENAWPLRVAALPRARADRLSPVRGVCMKSMVAAHLSLLITLHQAASLSRTAAAMSWGGAAPTGRGRPAGRRFCPLIGKRDALARPGFAPGRWVRPERPLPARRPCPGPGRDMTNRPPSQR